MKKIGSFILLGIGGIFLIYGLLAALNKHIIYYIRLDLPAICAIVMCIFNIIAPGLKKKKWINIVTLVAFALLIAGAVSELSHLTKIPNYMIGVEYVFLRIILLDCPTVFVCIGATLLVFGGRVLGSTRKRAI